MCRVVFRIEVEVKVLIDGFDDAAHPICDILSIERFVVVFEQEGLSRV